MPQTRNKWVLYGSELSPFTLKLQLLCHHTGLAFRFLPTEGSTLENLRIQWRLKRLISGHLPLTWPPPCEEQEFPLVPFLFGPNGENLYDSTAIAHWLDQHIATTENRLLPEEPKAAFICQLIDDYADEFGLYLVHHYRWKVSATDNNAGQRLAHEWRSLLGPAQPAFGAWFSARQVRRLPYLFSVAPQDYHVAGLPRRRQPPSLPDFPPTHDLIETAFERLLDCLEALLSQQAYLLGGRLTLADAAIYGQLAMNLDDPSAAVVIEQRAPKLFQWLTRLRRGDMPSGGGELQLHACLLPLVDEICRTHIPLMQQNLVACNAWLAHGESLFNEAAFNNRQALYEGQLDGRPFRHVAKRFQAQTWRQCQSRWNALPGTATSELLALFPSLEAMNHQAAEPTLIKV